MLTCDICGKDITEDQMNVVDGSLIEEIAEKGYVPKSLAVEELNAVFGLDRALIWLGTARGQAGAQWGLCAKCLRDVRGFGTRKWWQFWK